MTFEKVFFKLYSIITIILIALLALLWIFVCKRVVFDSEKNTYSEYQYKNCKLLLPKDVVQNLNNFIPGISKSKKGEFYQVSNDNYSFVSNFEDTAIFITTANIKAGDDSITSSLESLLLADVSFNNLNIMSQSSDRYVLQGNANILGRIYSGKIIVLPSTKYDIIIFITPDQIIENSISNI